MRQKELNRWSVIWNLNDAVLGKMLHYIIKGFSSHKKNFTPLWTCRFDGCIVTPQPCCQPSATVVNTVYTVQYRLHDRPTLNVHNKWAPTSQPYRRKKNYDSSDYCCQPSWMPSFFSNVTERRAVCLRELSSSIKIDVNGWSNFDKKG